jgi:hypothetical protein
MTEELALTPPDVPGEEYEATVGKVTVCFIDIGEGYSGDFDPEDPTDVPLYRVDVTQDIGADLTVEDGDTASFCTNIRLDLKDYDYQSLAQKAAEYAAAFIADDGSTRGAAERISWWTTDTQTSPFDKEVTA